MIRINMPAMRATTGVMWAAVITMAFPGFAEIRGGRRGGRSAGTNQLANAQPALSFYHVRQIWEPAATSRPGRFIARPTLHHFLEPAAEQEHGKGKHQADENEAPFADRAGDAERGGEPGAGRRGQPVHAAFLSRPQDDTGAEKADAGDDALHDAARRRNIPGSGRRHHRERGAEPDEAQRAHARGLAVDFAVEPERGADERRQAEPERDFKRVHAPSLTSPAQEQKRVARKSAQSFQGVIPRSGRNRRRPASRHGFR